MAVRGGNTKLKTGQKRVAFLYLGNRNSKYIEIMLFIKKGLRKTTGPDNNLSGFKNERLYVQGRGKVIKFIGSGTFRRLYRYGVQP